MPPAWAQEALVPLFVLFFVFLLLQGEIFCVIVFECAQSVYILLITYIQPMPVPFYAQEYTVRFAVEAACIPRGERSLFSGGREAQGIWQMR